MQAHGNSTAGHGGKDRRITFSGVRLLPNGVTRDPLQWRNGCNGIQPEWTLEKK